MRSLNELFHLALQFIKPIMLVAKRFARKGFNFLPRRLKVRLLAFLGIFLAVIGLPYYRFLVKRVTRLKTGFCFLLPDDYRSAGNNYRGAAKDIQSMLEDFQELGLPSNNILLPRNSTLAIFSLIKSPARIQEIAKFRAAVISIPGHPGLLIVFLRITGISNFIFRSHNAELFHRWDWVKRSQGLASKLKNSRKLLLGSVSDLIASIYSSSIWSVSDVEINRYWTKIFPWATEKCHFFPGASPKYLRRNAEFSNKTPDSNRDLALIIGSFDFGTLISQADEDFQEAGWRIREVINQSGLKLASVGEGVFFDFCDYNFGFVSDYQELLNRVEVVILPSSYGWGFKTKIVDAVTMKQQIIVHSRLCSRYDFWAPALTCVNSWSNISETKISKKGTNVYDVILEEVYEIRKKLYLTHS